VMRVQCVRCALSSLGGDHPGEIKKELLNLALPAIVGQAIDPVAQLLETAYIGRLGKFSHLKYE
jgi:Na+-driven multidrug efflux pump